MGSGMPRATLTRRARPDAPLGSRPLPSFLPTYARNDDHVLSPHPAQNSPRNAPWRKRHFHIQAPDGYEISFANRWSSAARGDNSPEGSAPAAAVSPCRIDIAASCLITSGPRAPI